MASTRLSIRQSLLLSPFVFNTWCRARKLGHRLRFRRLDTVMAGAHGLHGQAKGDLARVISYNVGMMNTISRERMERLISLIRHVAGFDVDKRRVLCIGPRNDAELLLLRAYGFQKKSITAIDLLSTSPDILLMDMHEMTFDDSTFDLVFASYVIAYSHDRPRACAEFVRVVKPGGLIAISFVYQEKVENVVGLEPIRGGLNELLGWFEHHVEQVYWREQKGRDCATVFSVRKH